MFKSAWIASIVVAAGTGMLGAAEGAKLVTPPGLQKRSDTVAPAKPASLRPAKIAEADVDSEPSAAKPAPTTAQPAASKPEVLKREVARRDAVIVDASEKPAEVSSRRTATSAKTTGRISFQPAEATVATGLSKNSGGRPSLVAAYLASKEQPTRPTISIVPVERTTARRTQKVVERVIAPPPTDEAVQETPEAKSDVEAIESAEESGEAEVAEPADDDGNTENFAPIISAADLRRPGSMPESNPPETKAVPPVKLLPTSPSKLKPVSPPPVEESGSESEQPDGAQHKATKPARQVSTLMGKLHFPDFRSRPQPTLAKPK
jgi:hypothetical protein